MKFLYFADRKRNDAEFSCITTHNAMIFNLNPPMMKNWRVFNEDGELERIDLLDVYFNILVVTEALKRRLNQIRKKEAD